MHLKPSQCLSEKSYQGRGLHCHCGPRCAAGSCVKCTPLHCEMRRRVHVAVADRRVCVAETDCCSAIEHRGLNYQRDISHESHEECANTGQPWIPRMSCGKLERSEVYKVHVCKTDTWQIHIYLFVFLCLPKRRCTPQVSIHYVPRNPWGKICPHKSEVFNTSDIGYLGPSSGKLLRGPSPIRGIDGLGPFPRYQTSEV